jgi:putative transcriptional regulator
MPKRYGSEALAAVHEVALGLAEAGAMAKRRLRRFDALCLTPVEPLSPTEIRALRLREKNFLSTRSKKGSFYQEVR